MAARKAPAKKTAKKTARKTAKTAQTRSHDKRAKEDPGRIGTVPVVKKKK